MEIDSKLVVLYTLVCNSVEYKTPSGKVIILFTIHPIDEMINKLRAYFNAPFTVIRTETNISYDLHKYPGFWEQYVNSDGCVDMRYFGSNPSDDELMAITPQDICDELDLDSGLPEKGCD